MTLHVLAAGRTFPVTLSTREAAEVLNVSPDTVRRHCLDGALPLMPRAADSAAPWRIPTARLFDVLGLNHETVTQPLQFSPSHPLTPREDTTDTDPSAGESDRVSSPSP